MEIERNGLKIGGKRFFPFADSFFFAFTTDFDTDQKFRQKNFFVSLQLEFSNHDFER